MVIQTIPNQAKTNLVHETTALVALSMATHKEYRSFNNPGSYDAGMNFLGFRRPANNPQAPLRHATLTFTWNGSISVPVAYDEIIDHVPNVLYDFNGSAIHDQRGNDHRWFLPYGSSGLLLNSVVIPDDEHLYQAWLVYHPVRKRCFWVKSDKATILKAARKWLSDLNAQLQAAPFNIQVVRKEPKHP